MHPYLPFIATIWRDETNRPTRPRGVVGGTFMHLRVAQSSVLHQPVRWQRMNGADEFGRMRSGYACHDASSDA